MAFENCDILASNAKMSLFVFAFAKFFTTFDRDSQLILTLGLGLICNLVDLQKTVSQKTVSLIIMIVIPFNSLGQADKK